MYPPIKCVTSALTCILYVCPFHKAYYNMIFKKANSAGTKLFEWLTWRPFSKMSQLKPPYLSNISAV